MTTTVTKTNTNTSIHNALSSRRLKGFLSTTALTAAGAIALYSTPALADNWVDLNQDAGQFNTDISIPDTTNINVLTQNAVGSGDLDITENHTVNVNQLSSSSRFVAIDTENDPTYIQGRLNSNGTIFVLDENGIFFGENSSLDVHNFVGGTGELMNKDDFMGGADAVIGNFGDGSIVNHGTINAAEAGLVAFVGPHVANHGVINAKLGKVVLAAGAEQATVDLYGDGLVELAVDEDASAALIENTGEINAEGGTVLMTAEAAKGIVDEVINTSGIVNVSSVEMEGGKIVLKGGDGNVSVSGKLDATGTTGGDIEVTGQYVAADAGAELDASGVNGGGTIHFGGDYQGGGDTPTSQYAYVDQAAVFRANALENGDGGQIIVWSDEGTGMYGDIEAMGGALGGDGGFVEVSSLGFFDFAGGVDTTAANGNMGLLLLDPRDIEIRGGVGDSEDNGGVGAAGNFNLGDGGTGFITFANDYGLGSGLMTIYESEIEGQSATTNINIQARRNITTALGTSLDGVVNLANNSNLTIQTQNGGGNTGSINLTNLGFETSGTGSINVIGSNGGSNAGDIQVGDLTSENGNISVSTDNGFILSSGLINVTGTGDVTLTAEDQVQVDGSGITTQGGNVSLYAGTNGGSSDDVLINSDITTNGGDFLARAGDDVRLSPTFSGAEIRTGGGSVDITTLGLSGGSEFTMGTGSVIDTTGSDAPVTILADDYGFDAGTINAGDNVVTFGRATDGQISLGDNNGGAHLSQTELGNITAGTVTVGVQANGVDNNVRVDNVNMLAFDTTNINTKTPSGGSDEDVTFEGVNNFNTLNVFADDNVIFADDAVVTTYGDATFTTDTNIGGVGGFFMGDRSRLDSSGNDIEINTLGVLMGTNAEIDADGGDIDINNMDVFAAATPDSVRTHTTGTISLNQWDQVVAYGGGLVPGLIQNAIDAIRNMGTGQNTLDVHKGTGDGVFTENVTVNQANLKLNGVDDNGGAPDVVIQAAVNTSPAISVEAANFNLDPVVVDAAGGDYGLVATGVGADGLVVDGNTFVNSTEAGIYLARTAATTANIMNNIFDASATRGIETGTLGGGYTLNITDNVIGVDGAEVQGGILFGRINTATVNVSGGSIDSSGPGDAIHFSQGTHSGALVNISDIEIDADGDEAIDFQQAVRAGSTVNIMSGDYRGGNNGIEFDAIAGTVNIGTDGFATNVDGQGADKRGVNLLGSITGDLTITNAYIVGTDDAVGSNATQGNTVNGGSVSIIDSVLAGENGDGLELGALTNGASVSVTDGTNIYAGGHGVHFVDGVNASTVLIDDVTVSSEGSGVFFGAGSPSVTNGSEVTISGSTFLVGSHGIYFEDIVDGGSTVEIIDNDQPELLTEGIYARDVGVFVNRAANGDFINAGASYGDAAVPVDGVRFAGGISNAEVTVANTIISTPTGDGVAVYSNSPSLSGGAVLNIVGNEIDVAIDGVYIDDDITGAGTTLNVQDNDIEAGDDGVDVDHVANGATVNVGGPGADDGNYIKADGNGIEFDAGVDATVLIQKNRISAGEDGINIRDEDAGSVTGVDGGAMVSILGNMIGSEGSDTIGDDGIQFEDSVTGNSTVIISGNNIGRSGAKVGDDGIEFDSITGGASVSITNNPDIRAGDNGIQVNGAINGGASLTITGNNHGIHANNHGMYFGGPISGGALLNIHDNIIGANEDGGVIGSGIWFDGTITNATVNIGDGTSSPFTGGASNIIRVDGTAGDPSGLDGIHFDDTVGSGAVIKIDGNRLGYYANSVGGALSNERLADDGIQFAGSVTGTADIDITDNYIRANDDGVQFSGVVNGMANILIGGANDANVINANDDGVVFQGSVTGQALVAITHNDIDAGADGVLFAAGTNNALNPGVSEEEILIAYNEIDGDDNGVRFAGLVSGERHDINIHNNDIDGHSGHGITFDAGVNDAEVRIHDNSSIVGDDDGIHFGGTVSNNALVEIVDNAHIEGEHDDGIDFVSDITSGSVVSIVSNDDIRADNTSGADADNGIEFAGVNGATVEILQNNHGIHANDHGIYFGGAVYNGADIDIHDNIISANQNNNGTGDGVHFASNIYTATINIGDGNGASFGSDPSNFIRGMDGIHFDGSLNSGTQIVIDGNRIGYGKTSVGVTYEDEMDDDGIQFIGGLNGDANVMVTDNFISADDDGVSFIGNIQDDARVLIGGSSDKNTIDADDDGIQFEGNISGHSLVEISHNVVTADDNGVQFDEDTSNHIHGGNPEEILIAYNSITGGDNGVIFYGEASNWRHDIMIRDNYLIRGNDDHGIAHVGDINDAELTIEHNDEIYGDEDGIHINGFFWNDAAIRIHGNSDVEGHDDDGIEVYQYGGDGGVDLEIDYNHVHHTGDDGIYVHNVRGADINNNEVHDTDGNGIYVSNSDYAEITSNDIWDTEENGIKVNPSDYVDIAYNTLHDIDWDGILVDNGVGADIWDNHIHRVGRDGIDVNNNNYVEIWGNDIIDTRDNGIEVSDSYRADIRWNDIDETDGNGIDVQDSSRAKIHHNEINRHEWWANTQGHGIYVDNSYRVDVHQNDVDDTNQNGIFVENSNRAEINYNKVEDAGWNGIYLSNSDYGDIFGNDIDDVGRNGIKVNPSDFVDIAYNSIHDAGWDGILVDGGIYADIWANHVHRVGDDGIDVNGNFGVDINGNRVIRTGEAWWAFDANGIEVSDSWFADINGNNISFTRDDGIEVDDSFAADINGNTIAFAGGDGVDVDDSWFVDVNGNNIAFVAEDGVQVRDSSGADINGNNIAFIGDDGVDVRGSSFVDVNGNTIFFTAGDGIQVRGGVFHDINNNFIRFAGDDGIDLEDSFGSGIVGNDIQFVAANGIEVEDSSTILIDDNDVADATLAGIFVDPSTNITVSNNRLDMNGKGIYFMDVTDSTIVGNVIDNSDTSGIELYNVDGILVEDNTVSKSGDQGLYARGGTNGLIEISGNTFNDNTVGTRIESGEIDLTGDTNFINGGVTGMIFDRFGGTAPLSLVAGPGDIPITDGTFGTTTFTGQSGNYIEFYNNAFSLGAGAPIFLDASFATFDGFTPDSVARNPQGIPILTQAQFDFLEGRILHFNDLDTLGLVLFGVVPDDLDEEDFFRLIDGFAAGAGPLNVTITGLPLLPGAPTAGGLAGIAPAAGGEDDEGAPNAAAEYFASLEPAAGDEAAAEATEGDVADIEPAAGGEVNCWSDAVSGASGGSAVNFSFGGNFEDSLATAGACQSGDI